MRTGFKSAIVPALVAGLVVLMLPFLATDASAGRVRRARRARAVRRVVVVGAAVRLAHPVIINGVAHGVIDFAVDPETTEVHVDGKLRGQVDDFDGHPGKLNLLPGVHTIELRTPDGEIYTRDVRIIAGHEINLKLDLEKDAGTQ
jgi:hypothetical protein